MMSVTEYMTDTELALSGADRVSLIKYYTLPGDIPGLLMIYGKNVPVNLCALDKGFDILEAAAKAAFEKNPGAAADEVTRGILKARSKRDIPACLAAFEEARGSRLPEMTFEKNFTAAMQPFIFFFLMQAYEGVNSQVEFIGDISGYRTQLAVRCRVSGRERILPLCVSRRNFGAVFTVGNILSPEHSAEISLSCGRTGIYVFVRCSLGREICREYTYDILEQFSRLRIFDGGIVYDKKKPLTPENPSDKFEKTALLTSEVCCLETGDFEVYPMPWGGVCMAKREELLWNFIIADMANNTASGNTALGNTANVSAVIRHFYRQYVPLGETGGNRMTVDSFNAVHEIFPRRRGENAVQTSFIPTGEFTCGRFKERLEGKYFTRPVHSPKKIKGETLK